MSQFNPNFSVDSYYDPRNPFKSILLAAGVPAIHAEMNEFQYIAGGEISNLYDDCLTDGLFNDGSIVYENGVLTITNIRIKFQGRVYIVDEVALVCTDGDVIYFVTWEQILTGLDVVRQNGYVNGPPLTNNIYYPGFNPPAETSRRKAMYYNFTTTAPVPPQQGMEFGRIIDGEFVLTMPGVAQKVGVKNAFGWLVDGPVDYTTVIEGYPEYNDGQVYGFIIASVDCSDNPTVNVNGIGAVNMQTVDGVNLQTGDMLVNNPYLFQYVVPTGGTPSFRMIGTAASSGEPVRHHTHSSNDLPIRVNAFTLPVAGWSQQTPSTGPFAGTTVYVQYVGLPTSIGIAETGEMMGAYFEINPSDINVSALLNYVAISDRWMIFHAVELPAAAISVFQVQIIGGSVGDFANPTTAPTTYPTNIAGAGLGNLGGVPWFGKFFSKIANTAGAFYEGDAAPTGTNILKFSGYLQPTRVYNAFFNDYAEAYKVVGDWEPGDLVALDPNSEDEQYVLADESTANLVVGVISDDYAQLIGMDEKNNVTVPVGMAGRVRVNVKGPVRVGDLLVASDTPGVAISWSHTPFDNLTGKVVAKALTASKEKGFGKVRAQIMLA